MTEAQCKDSLIDTLRALSLTEDKNQYLLKLLSQVIDFSKNRVVMGNERILHEEIIKILKESEKIT